MALMSSLYYKRTILYSLHFTQPLLTTVVDSKCDYPSACNAMETLLIHKSHIKSGLLDTICDELKKNGVS